MSHSGAVGSAPNCNFAPMVHPWFSTVPLVFDELCADYYPSTSHESHVFLETRQAFAETPVHVTLHEWLEDVSDCEITDCVCSVKSEDDGDYDRDHDNDEEDEEEETKKKDLLLLYYYGLDDFDMGYAVRAQSSPGKPSGAVTAAVVERLNRNNDGWG